MKAKLFAESGVDYLKYDDCGEANIQSYQKYFVMKDALAAAYGKLGKSVDYYSYEPFQVYAHDAIPQMSWVRDRTKAGYRLFLFWVYVIFFIKKIPAEK